VALSGKPETTFYTSVHRHLPPPSQLYRMKNNNQYVAGVADHWYSGKHDLWVEWKFIKVPVRDGTVIDLVGGKDPVISNLQQEWIKDRTAEGRAAWVIVGSEKGGAVFRLVADWQRPHTAAQFRSRLLSRPEIAACIHKFTSTGL
jgi:hypothetical protein